MSRTRPTPLEALAIRSTCDRCGRGPGLWCVATRHWWGQPYGPDEVAPWSPSLHQVRRGPVDDVWRVGYLEGVVEGLDEVLAELDRCPTRTPATETTRGRIENNRAWWAKTLRKALDQL